MEKVKYLILGAGPAGLTFANKLRLSGEQSFLVLEREIEPGGLCRSCEVDGSPLDIGGGHFLDVRSPEVTSFLFQFMPRDEWDEYERDSRILLKGGRVLHHPMEANIWELDIDSQMDYLKSIARAGCNMGAPMPERFRDWITWKLGERIAEDYMLPYNQKMFADDLDDLGTYWLEKLPDVSFDDTLRSCLERKAYGRQPGHARFLYPKKYGYGELWRRMGDALGDSLRCGVIVRGIDFDSQSVTDADGGKYQADVVVTTVPWREFTDIQGMPDGVMSRILDLRHSSIEVRYFEKNLDTAAHWIYIPEEKYPYHRILVRSNFCPGSQGYWTETRVERVPLFPDGENNFRYVNKYAYPLNTVKKREAVREILEFAATRGVYGLGRWGEHEHYNSDAVVERAMRLWEKIA